MYPSLPMNFMVVAWAPTTKPSASFVNPLNRGRKSFSKRGCITRMDRWWGGVLLSFMNELCVFFG